MTSTNLLKFSSNDVATNNLSSPGFATRESPEIDTDLLFSCNPEAWAEDAISALHFVAGKVTGKSLVQRTLRDNITSLKKRASTAKAKAEFVAAFANLKVRYDIADVAGERAVQFATGKRKRTINDDEAGENGNGARREEGAHAGAIGGQSSTGAEQGEDGVNDVASVANVNENRHEEASDDREDDVAEASNKYFDLMSSLLASAVEQRRKTEKRKGHFAKLERAKELLAELAEIIDDVEESLEEALEEEVEDEVADIVARLSRLTRRSLEDMAKASVRADKRAERQRELDSWKKQLSDQCKALQLVQSGGRS
ncbi:hypothetical protein BDZ88DRAFT_509718 [Geranomyces variabilis]|nr:hypothetical protein BDZ88DRAFT_509718 [Geranomyces variabilis]KAJ3138537.1 hypothetical protein HDU90_000978 [Geranomyces variabilis]